MISHDKAAAIVIALYEAGAEGAETLLQYVEELSQGAELTDRELTLRAWRRADEACYRLAELERRLSEGGTSHATSRCD